MKNLFLQIGNLLTGIILRSPLHGMLSQHTMLVAVTGQKSGRVISLPVNFFQEDGALYITSWRGRTWWRNLRGGAPVRLHLRGKDIQGKGTVLTERTDVLQGLKRWFQANPAVARAFSVRLETNGQPNLHDLTQLAQDRVLIKVSLDRSQNL